MRRLRRGCIVSSATPAGLLPHGPTNQSGNTHSTREEEELMKSHPFRRTNIAAAVGGAMLALAGGQAYGSAFALQEQSGSGLGNAFAGGAEIGRASCRERV